MRSINITTDLRELDAALLDSAALLGCLPYSPAGSGSGSAPGSAVKPTGRAQQLFNAEAAALQLKASPAVRYAIPARATSPSYSARFSPNARTSPCTAHAAATRCSDVEP